TLSMPRYHDAIGGESPAFMPLEGVAKSQKLWYHKQHMEDGKSFPSRWQNGGFSLCFMDGYTSMPDPKSLGMTV
ncbi:MAG: hypothetical protein RR135_00415, partial [Oscillospiraceae bacterium]